MGQIMTDLQTGNKYCLRVAYRCSSQGERTAVYVGKAVFRDTEREFFRDEEETEGTRTYFVLRDPVRSRKSVQTEPVAIRTFQPLFDQDDKYEAANVRDDYEIVFGVNGIKIEDIDFRLEEDEKSELLKILEEFGEI